MFPCKDCADRKQGCHSTCPKYIEANAKHTAQKEQIRKWTREYEDYEEFKKQNIRRYKRRAN